MSVVEAWLSNTNVVQATALSRERYCVSTVQELCEYLTAP